MPAHPLPLQSRPVRLAVAAASLLAAAACAGGAATLPPVDAAPVEPLEGSYAGQLVIEGRPFDATLRLRAASASRWTGSLSVVSPVEIEGSVEGVTFDAIVRLRVGYTGTDGCEGRIDGVLDVLIESDEVRLEGPVTIHDACGEPVAGSVWFVRDPGGPGPYPLASPASQ